MPSAKQVLAAQTNGRKSRGPKTPEGRRKSSANSRKHGLYGKDIQTDDACEAYRQWLLPSLIAKYLPANPTERGLVETIALAGARQDWAIRTSEAYFAQAIEAQANPEAPYQHPGRNGLGGFRVLKRFRDSGEIYRSFIVAAQYGLLILNAFRAARVSKRWFTPENV